MKKQTFIQPGDRFGRLTAIEYVRTGKHYRRHFRFHCDCGNETVITAEAAISGNTKSCGCLAAEVKRTRHLLPNNGGVVNHIILQYKRHARDRGIDWFLDREDVDRLVRLPCIYCGIAAGNLKKTKNCTTGFPHNGIDRLDPSLPYRVDNVAPCCGFCNRAKQSMTKDAFIAWAARVTAYQNTLKMRNSGDDHNRPPETPDSTPAGGIS